MEELTYFGPNIVNYHKPLIQIQQKEPMLAEKISSYSLKN